MRLLHARPDHERDRSDPRGSGGRRSRTDSRGHERQSLPLRRLCRNRRGRPRSTEGRKRRRSETLSMKNFDYVKPATIAEAIAAAAAPGASYLAAGTNLLDLMKGGVARPD